MKKKAISIGKTIGIIGGILGILFGIRSYERGFATAKDLDHGFTTIQQSLSDLSKQSTETHISLNELKSELKANIADTNHQVDMLKKDTLSTRESVDILSKEIDNVRKESNDRRTRILSLLQSKKYELLSQLWYFENKFGGPGLPFADSPEVKDRYAELKIKIKNLEKTMEKL